VTHRSGTQAGPRTVGVEEELLLVDARTGAPRSAASQVLRAAERRGETEPEETGGSIGPELQEQQIETDTPPRAALCLLESDLIEWRAKARAAASGSGALVLASGTTPLPVHPRTFDDPRYARMKERFGLTATEQLTCGCHVHVAVDSDDEAVGAMDRVRVWLPVLLALSANSPFWHGADTGYESYRAQALGRWPTSGPTAIHGTARDYAAHLRQLLGTGVPLDEGMAYYDVRPSRRYPTLEIRVADVCLDPRDAVVVAALCRALVDTAAERWRDGRPPEDASIAVLRLATWQASRHGIAGELLDPLRHRPRPAREVVDSLVAHVRPALETNGDARRTEEGLDRIFARGTGAARQRQALAEAGGLDQAVLRLAELTSPTA